MEKNVKIVLGLSIGIILVYLGYKLYKYFNSGKIAGAPAWVSCKSSFLAKMPDGSTHNFHASNDGTDSAPNMKYYKNDVTITEGGITNATVDVVITRNEFDDACQYAYNPPYEWYNNPSTGISIGHGKTIKK